MGGSKVTQGQRLARHHTRFGLGGPAAGGTWGNKVTVLADPTRAHGAGRTVAMAREEDGEWNMAGMR